MTPHLAATTRRSDGVPPGPPAPLLNDKRGTRGDGAVGEGGGVVGGGASMAGSVGEPVIMVEFAETLSPILWWGWVPHGVPTCLRFPNRGVHGHRGCRVALWWHPMAPTKLAASRGGINDPTYDPPTTGTPCTTPCVPQCVPRCVDDVQMCRRALTVTAGP